MKIMFLSFPRLIIGTLATVSFVFFLSFKWVNHQWRYNIASDGKGYYVYLPAAFIYHDFSFQFTEKTEAIYNPGSIQPPVAQLPDGKKLNKYFVGEALLLIPFFLIAHVLTILFQLPADGYSFIYAIMVSVAALFYALAGLYMLNKLLLDFKVTNNIRAITFIVVFGGSTLLHYTWMEPSMSHVYSFFAINTFLALAANYFKHQQKIKLYLLFLTLGLICLIRPVNALVVLTLPFVWLMIQPIVSPINMLKNSFKTLILGTFLFAAIIFIQLGLYQLQIGQWWIWAYTNEGFNFSNAHFFDIIFSFRKGWLIYTPIALVSLLLAVYIWHKNLFVLCAFFMPLIVILYVASSWYDWAYGASFGCRPMTEMIGFVMIPFALSLQIIKNRITKLSLFFLVWCFLLLNCVQVYQINKHILLWDNMSFKAYKASFLKTSDADANMLEETN
jgi:hypothetical protein